MGSDSEDEHKTGEDNPPPSGQNSTGHIEKVSIKLPTFWASKPALWFNVVEAQFNSKISNTNVITDDATKYYYVLKSLDENVLEKVEDIISNPPDKLKYKALKTALIQRLADSDNVRVQKLTKDLELGDKKPSQLLREMKSLAGTTCPERLLKTLWLQRLPQHTQQILSVSTAESLTEISAMADKISEINISQDVFAITNAQTPKPSTSTAQCINDVNAQLKKLTLEINELRQNRPRQRSRSRSGKQPQQSGSGNVCYYHRRFKAAAKKCRQPCNYKAAPN